MPLNNAEPLPTDIQVGVHLRNRRIELSFSQQGLGDALGLSFQQIQKYESGANRIAASRLFDISQTLGVTPNYFFGLEGEASDLTEHDRERLELLRDYNGIPSDPLRAKIRGIVREIRKETE